MHEIETTERFTLLGSNAKRGKLTLFDAPGPGSQARYATLPCACLTWTQPLPHCRAGSR